MNSNVGLDKKDFRPVRIDLCLDQLEAKGLLNDEATAAAFIRDRLRHRPRGKARLSSELRSKGLDADIAYRVINDVFEDEGTDDLSLARQVAEGWLRRQNRNVVKALADTNRSQRPREGPQKTLRLSDPKEDSAVMP